MRTASELAPFQCRPHVRTIYRKLFRPRGTQRRCPISRTSVTNGLAWLAEMVAIKADTSSSLFLSEGSLNTLLFELKHRLVAQVEHFCSVRTTFAKSGNKRVSSSYLELSKICHLPWLEPGLSSSRLNSFVSVIQRRLSRNGRRA